MLFTCDRIIANCKYGICIATENLITHGVWNARNNALIILKSYAWLIICADGNPELDLCLIILKKFKNIIFFFNNWKF